MLESTDAVMWKQLTEISLDLTDTVRWTELTDTVRWAELTETVR